MNLVPSIHWLDSVDSTSTEITRHIDSLEDLYVVAAVNQTAGRGQRGNVWSVEPGANLTFSFLLKFSEGRHSPLKAAAQFSISEAVTLALAEYFESEGIEVRIKWPNDVYVKNKKIVGILIENGLNGNFLKTSIVGIGINCNQVDFPPQVANATSMTLLTKKHYDTHTELEKVMSRICAYLGDMETLDGRKKLHENYQKKLFRLREIHNYRDCLSGEVFEGRILGISDSAKLRLEKMDGTVREFAFKEVSYIL